MAHGSLIGISSGYEMALCFHSKKKMHLNTYSAMGIVWSCHQVSGLASFVSDIYPEINRSSWIGGDMDNVGDLHETVPYWLNGVVPLVFALGGETQESMSSSYFLV